MSGEQLGELQAQIEQDYADDLAQADALYSRAQQLASAARQAMIESASARRSARLELLPTEVEK